MRRRLLMTLTCWFAAGFTILAQGADDGFRPLSELPPGQELPAAPFVIAAYAFIWIALMAYLWSIWRRIGKVEREIRALEKSAPASPER